MHLDGAEIARHRRSVAPADVALNPRRTILLNSSRIGPDLIDFVAVKSPHKHGMFLPGASDPHLSR